MPLEIIGPEYLGEPGYSQTTFAVNREPSTSQVNGAYPMSFHERRVTTRRPKPRRSWIDPTPYERSTTSSRHRGAYRDRTLKSYPEYLDGYTYRYIESGMLSYPVALCQNVALPSVTSNTINRAVTGALLNLKDQKVNLAQAWAERKMTANLLADSMTRIARSVNALRRGNWRKAGRYLRKNWKQPPKSWLEYQYGWNPLLQDIYGACEALAYADTVHWIMTVKENVAIEESSSKYFEDGLNAGIHDKDTFQGAFVRLDYIPNHTFFQVLSQTGFTNPAQLAWELVPFSFVLDWGVAVGDYLSSLDAAVGWEFKSGSLTTLQEITSKVKVLPPQGKPGTNWEYARCEGNFWHKKRSLKRTVYTASPLPRAPVYKSPMSVGHVANALALLSQALSKGPVKPRGRKASHKSFV